MHAGFQNQTSFSTDENCLYRRRRRSACRFLLPEFRTSPQQAGLCDSHQVRGPPGLPQAPGHFGSHTGNSLDFPFKTYRILIP